MKPRVCLCLHWYCREGVHPVCASCLLARLFSLAEEGYNGAMMMQTGYKIDSVCR